MSLITSKLFALIFFINLLITTNILAVAITDSKSSVQPIRAMCIESGKAHGSYISYDKLNSSEIVRILGWERNPYSNTLCEGCYADSANIVMQKPLSMKDAPMDVTANKIMFFTKDDTSLVKGNVTLTQPGRKITSDCVTFLRDKNTGKISSGVLIGHVVFREYGKLVYAEEGYLNFAGQIHSLNNGYYRFLVNTPSGLTNVWGQVKHVIRDAMGVLKMQKATYSACPPDATSWCLWSNNLILDRNIGRGEATSATFFIKKMPIFYVPYLNFSIDNRRKSGFLYPNVSYSKDSGYGMSLPYYFNLATNYDATLTPNFFIKRGILMHGLFRYLTSGNKGNINVDYIPYDESFVNFRGKALYSLANSDYEEHAYSVLHKSLSSRGSLKVQNNSYFNEHWSGILNINYVTDDYFLQDFGSEAIEINKDQLFNKAEISYANEYWRFSCNLQGFQTLHRIGAIVKDQYRRLPQLVLTGDFSDVPGRLSYKFNTEVVNFTKRDYFSTSKSATGGGRFNIIPELSLPLNWISGYIVPKVQLQATAYGVHDREKASDPNNISRFLPLITINGGSVFSRAANFFRHSYTQTLEPRLFYLYVPIKNQDDIPCFDTVLPAFDFNQLFRANRFSGVDRIGDANQITVAITTRLLDDSGQEKINASFGQIFSVHRHQVKMGDGIDPLVNEDLSPLAGQLQYFINSRTKFVADVAWDPNYHRFNTTNISWQYNDNAEKVVNFWYNYALKGAIYSSQQKINPNLNRVGCSLGWRLWQHWNILSSIGYDISERRSQDYLYGLEYDSCCWAIRLVRDGTFVSSKNSYEARTYLQFVLKGLGSRDVLGNLESVLPNKISNYSSRHDIGL